MRSIKMIVIVLGMFSMASMFGMGSLPRLAAAQGIEKYTPVTSERLLKPEPQNWLMYRGTTRPSHLP